MDPSIGAHTYSCLRYSSKQAILAAGVVAGIVSWLYRAALLKVNGPAIRYDHYQFHQKSPGKDRLGVGQSILQNISLNTSVDVISMPKACTSGNQLPIGISTYLWSMEKNHVK